MSGVADTDALQAVRNLLNVNIAGFSALGAIPPHALLLSGPPGVGKTNAVRIAAEEADIPVSVVLPGPTAHLRLLEAFAPSQREDRDSKGDRAEHSKRIVFIDEIDAVCPNRTSLSSRGLSSRATCLLLSLMDTSVAKQRISQMRRDGVTYVIAATNRSNAVDSRLRSPGHFDREVNLQPPTAVQRYAILKALEPAAEDALLKSIADRASGFVAADLAAICKEARSLASEAPSSSNGSSCDVSDSKPLARDLRTAFHRTTPSVLRDTFAAEVPDCHWDDVGGLDEVKKRLRMAVEWPLRYSNTFDRLGLKAPRGILLHGPPGCSKTTLVRAAASQSRVSFLRLNGADIYSCYLGEAERILRQAFASARAASPCILFLDEIDAIVGKRSTGGGQTDGNGVQERVLSTLLTEMDGVVSASGVLVIGATNRVDLLDDALLRPGRFDDILEVELPDEVSLLEILRIHSSNLPLDEDVDLRKIAQLTIGRSGADIKALCTEAGLAALRERLSAGAAVNLRLSPSTSEMRVAMRHFSI